MKKFILLGVSALIGMSAVAQQNVVKEAERAMKAKKSFTEVQQIMQPAFTDPTTAESAQTYYVVGKAGYNQYDDMTGLKAFGKLQDKDIKPMNDALLGGYKYMMKALPLDKLPNEKGKVKPKYTKDIINVVAGHYNDFNSAAIDYWNLKDYQNAYDAWEIFLTLPENGEIRPLLQVLPDTIMAEIAYNQALAAWQLDDLDKALDSFMKAKNMGYTKKNIYDYAIAVAAPAGKMDVVTELAREAMPLYGKEDPNYVGYIINDYLDKKQFNEAIDMINQAIEANPDNAQYYVVKGILFGQDEVEGDPAPEFLKALELDPYNAQALFQYGYLLYQEAMVINDNAPTDDQAYSKVYFEEIKPLLLKSVDYLEQAYNVNDELTDALKVLASAYYVLQDEKNLERVNNLLNQ